MKEISILPSRYKKYLYKSYQYDTLTVKLLLYVTNKFISISYYFRSLYISSTDGCFRDPYLPVYPNMGVVWPWWPTFTQKFSVCGSDYKGINWLVQWNTVYLNQFLLQFICGLYHVKWRVPRILLFTNFLKLNHWKEI